MKRADMADYFTRLRYVLLFLLLLLKELLRLNVLNAMHNMMHLQLNLGHHHYLLFNLLKLLREEMFKQL